MKLSTIDKKATSLGLDAEPAMLAGHVPALFVSLEKLVDGQARPIDRKTEADLMNYLRRYRVKYEYRGHYTSILITN